ncbi:MAG: tetraacyldisaccharide 4'-kinase [Bacteroidota bacterium]
MKKRQWLLPFSLLYGAATAVRNFLYDAGLFKSVLFEKPVILVGNLSTGGTGKSPHVSYLVDMLRSNCKVATLSRGYGRKTKGFIAASAGSNAAGLGDEPMMYHLKFPDVQVFVGEDRAAALKRIFNGSNVPDVVVMDDGYQHRSVDASFKILLTTYNDPFTADYLLPAGGLRESKSGYWRADCIVVTGCPDAQDDQERQRWLDSIKPLPHQQVFFSKMVYGDAVSFGGKELGSDRTYTNAVTFAGIANPAAFFKQVKSCSENTTEISFPDHHNFLRQELVSMVASASDQTTFITTEKDYVRLKSNGLLDVFQSVRACYIPITIQLNDATAFEKMITEHLQAF